MHQGITFGLISPSASDDLQGRRDETESLLARVPAISDGSYLPASTPGQPPRATGTSPRMPYLDWLRTFLTVTVVIHHCFYIYGYGWWPYYGAWLAVFNPFTSLVCWTVLAFNQAYFMGLFFFISGLCASPSLVMRGPRGYLKSRALRLLVPALAFDLFLAPLTCVIAKGVNTFDLPAGLATAPSTWAWYFMQYDGLGKNPCWFLWLLFLFDLAVVAADAIQTRIGWWSKGTGQGRHNGPDTSPSAHQATFSDKELNLGLAAVILVLSLLSFSIRAAYPIGTWARLFGFIWTQPAYLGQYALAFALGCRMATGPLQQRHHHQYEVESANIDGDGSLLSRIPRGGRYGLVYAAVAFTIFAVGWTAVLFLAVFNIGSHPAAEAKAAGGRETPDPTAPLMGGWGPEALFFAIFEQSFAVLWSLGLLILARDRLQGEAREGTGWWVTCLSSLARSVAYAAYLIHPLVVFALVRGVTAAWPVDSGGWNVAAHILLVIPLAVGGSWVLAAGLKAIPYLSVIL